MRLGHRSISATRTETRPLHGANQGVLAATVSAVGPWRHAKYRTLTSGHVLPEDPLIRDCPSECVPTPGTGKPVAHGNSYLLTCQCHPPGLWRAAYSTRSLPGDEYCPPAAVPGKVRSTWKQSLEFSVSCADKARPSTWRISAHRASQTAL